MDPERWVKVKQIYHAALQLEPERQEPFLKEACAGDESVLKEVATLLAQQGKSEGIFAAPALDAVAKALAEDVARKPLPDLIGQTLSHYRIEKKIGEGGMGEVFLAQDSSLNRKVALKFLPPEMQQDLVARKRFLREARSAAALDNPFICSIHEVGEFEGKDFIAMEYVDGQTVMERLRRGRLPLNQALQIATEAAEALQAAHCKGIIHRDLKPSNIMLMKTGHAKVMDFGLAKQIVSSGGIESQEESVTTMTRSGMTLGTLAYMSPEQVRGEEVDARSDIFSFGLVLYEMLTGTHPFRKENQLDTASAILHEEPKPARAITKGIPADLEKLISRCLRKDAERRIQHMDDVKLALVELKEEMAAGRLNAGVPAAKKHLSYLWLSIILLAGCALAVASWLWLGSSRRASEESSLTPIPLTTYPGTETYPSFSPDGTQVAYQGCPEGWSPGKNCDIYAKQIGLEPPSRLTDTPEQEYSPAWSPDGAFIAFLRQLSIEKMALVIMPQRKGPERVLEEFDVSGARILLDGPYLAWTPDSKWIATPIPEPASGVWSLWLLSVESGEKRRLTNPPASVGEGGDTAPSFSPDGSILAFARIHVPESDLCLLRLDRNYQPQGEPMRVISENPYSIGASWTPDGREIVFSSGIRFTIRTSMNHGLWCVAAADPTKPRRLPFAQDDARSPAISRLGNRLAYSVQRSDTNIWSVDLQGPGRKPGLPYRLISSTRREYSPALSPDGKRIAFLSDRSGLNEIWLCDNDGSYPVRLTSFGRSARDFGGMQWSPDGKSIVFDVYVEGRFGVHVISANGGAPRRLTTDPQHVGWPCWSHDGWSIYFRSARSGSLQIWKMPAGGGDAVQISHDPDGADQPQESPDGKFIYYSKGWPNPKSVWRVAVEGGEPVKVLDGVHPLAGWTVGFDGIYFFAKPDEKGRSHLSVYEFTTGKTLKILTIERPVTYQIEVSRDGRTILYTQVDEVGSDLMLVENFR